MCLCFATALDVEGIFRQSGSAKRIKDLQVIFDSPDRYGKGLNWDGYTVHDAANILRRYLNQLPQPIIPLEFYEKFREPLRNHQSQAVGDIEAQAEDEGDFHFDAAITTYQQLITELPPLNRQLLLYILDLLSVFASKAEMNRMNSANLSAIFQPGMLSHPDHDMLPEKYRLSQDVINFLIENQDHFLVGMRGTAADEDTVKEIQSGVHRQPNTPTRLSQAGLGRSASNASAGADSLRKSGGIRRNVSVSSKNSRSSGNTPVASSPAPGSPLTNTSSGGGVQRSNTVPSKKSPGIPPARFRNADASTSTPRNLSTGGLSTSPRATSPGSRLAQSTVETWSPASKPPVTPSAERASGLNSVPEAKEAVILKPSSHRTPGSAEKLTLRTPEQGTTTTITGGSSATPTKERKTLFSKSPSSDNEHKDLRQPNKLRKKRISGVSPNASAQSSTHSLHGAPGSPVSEAFHTPMPTPSVKPSNDPLASAAPVIFSTEATPRTEQPPQLGEVDKLSAFHVSQPNSTPGASPLARATISPPGSMRSRTSATEESEFDHTDDGNGLAQTVKKEKKHRWRLSSSAKPANLQSPSTPSGSRLGSNAVAEKSNTSILSDSKHGKSVTNDSHQTHTTGTEASTSSTRLHSSNESTPPKEKEAAREVHSGAEDKEKKGPIGWFKGKVAKVKEERKEREAEKERAKSPPRGGSEHAASKQSLGAIANQDALPTRGRSTDAIAEASEEQEVDKVTAEKPMPMPALTPTQAQ